MKLVRLRLSNFRSFSADYTELDLDNLTFRATDTGSACAEARFNNHCCTAPSTSSAIA